MQVFLSYATEDFKKADRLYKYLMAMDIEIWMDKYNLSGGEIWDEKIEKEILKSKIFLAVLSKLSINKTGVIQKEFKIAKRHQDTKPSKDIYIIPIMIEDCEIPDDFGKYQYVDLTNPDGYVAVYDSIKKAFEVEEKYGKGEVKINILKYNLHSEKIINPAINIEKKDFVFTSPFDGVFYRGSSPGQPPYCRDGDKIQKGGSVFLIETCKVFFEFKADEEGFIGAFLADNNEFIKKGSPLIVFSFNKK